MKYISKYLYLALKKFDNVSENIIFKVLHENVQISYILWSKDPWNFQK